MSSNTAPECPLGLTTEDLSGWRDGDLPPDRMRHVEAHVAECGACQQRLARFEPTASGLRAIPEPALDVPHFWAGLRAQYPSKCQHRRLGQTGGRRTLIGLAAVAAALLIALGFAQLFALRGTELNARTTTTAATATTATVTAATTTPSTTTPSTTVPDFSNQQFTAAQALSQPRHRPV